MQAANVRVFLFGDTALAAQYVPWAKNQCNALIQQAAMHSLPYLDRHTRLGDNVEVRLHAALDAYGSWVSITVTGGCNLYVDHGILGLGNLAPQNYLRYSDGLLVLPNHLTSNLLYAAQTASTAGLSSKNALPFVSGTSPGCCKKQVFPPETPNSEVAAANEAFYAHKLTLNTCPPSMYSGKLRLLVQSLYGRKYGAGVTDNYRVVTEAGIPKVRIKTNIPDGNDVNGYVTLTNIAGQSHGLYTDSVGGYWLLWVHTGNGKYRVTIYRVEITACGKAIAAWLASQTGMSKEDKAIQEAALLADAKIDYNFSWTVETNIDATYGAPIAYGWSFKWDGSQAIMTCQKLNGAGTSYESTRLTLNFVRTNTEFAESSATELEEEQARWSISGIVAGMGTWNPQIQRQNIWYPNYFENKLSYFYNPPNFTGSGAGEVACLFDKNDVIVPITISAISTPFQSVETYNEDTYYAATNIKAFIEGTTGFVEVRNYSSGGHEGTIVGGGITLNSVLKTVQSGSRSDWGVESGGSFSPESTSFIPRSELAIPDPGTCTNPDSCWRENLGEISGYHAADEAYDAWLPSSALCQQATYYKATTSANYEKNWSIYGTSSERTTVIFPFFDCNTIYLCTNGRLDALELTGTIDRRGTQYGTVSWRTDCFGGSPWFENKYIKAGAAGLVTVGAPDNETRTTQGPEIIYAVGYSPAEITGYNAANSIFSVNVDDPTTSELMTTESSAVDGVALLYGDVIVGDYDVSSLGAITFVGAA